MKILLACEESQAVCIEMRKKGHEAFSCDIQPCTGNHPEWHIQDDVIPLLNINSTDTWETFTTQDGKQHNIDKWDMIIAFPPCTHLAVSGARHFEKKREDGRQLEAIKFFKACLESNCPRVAVENPVNIIGSKYIKEHFPEFANLPNPTQYIQPYYFGDNARKKTGLWLKGLPNLIATNIVEPDIVSYTCKNGKKVTFSRDYCYNFDWKDENNRSKNRSKTYPGIAKAMADQWAWTL